MGGGVGSCGPWCAAAASPIPPSCGCGPTGDTTRFVTDVELGTVEVDQFHRDHATVELDIRDLKEGAGMEHCPSGRFFANAAWLGCALLAHNLIRWTVQLGGVHPEGQLTVARTVRALLLGVPGRLVNRAGRLLLRLPERWPWASTFLRAMTHLHALPAAPG